MKEKKKSLSEQIFDRTASASERVKTQIRIILADCDWYDDEGISDHLEDIRSDFPEIVKSPDAFPAPEWATNPYAGWSPDDVRELYLVLYGDELKEEEN